MSFFGKINRERSESVSLKTLIVELSEQELCAPQEISATLLREYEKEFPEYEVFDFYYHDLVKSFVTISKAHCFGLLNRCAHISDFSEVELFYPVENSASGLIDMKEIIVRAEEMSLFLMNADVRLPPCLKHVSKITIDTFNRRYAAKYTLPPPKSVIEENLEWDKFRGRETALTLISGLSMALSRDHANCRIKGRLNKSAIANIATNTLIDAGFLSEVVSDRQIRNLLTAALESTPFSRDEENGF